MLRLSAFGAWVAALVLAAAAAVALPTASQSLGAGVAALVPCDGDGIFLRYRLDVDARVTQVELRDVSTACSGSTARVTLLSGPDVIASGSASVPANAFTGTVPVTLDAPVSAASVSSTRVAIDGR